MIYMLQTKVVGPHIDNYDVFLIQGYGKRRENFIEKQMEDDFIEDLISEFLKNLMKPTAIF